MARPGSSSTRRSTSVVFPAPDGAATLKRHPRGRAGLLDILDLLPHFLEFRLGRDDELRDAKSIGLRAHRVDLAVHLLQQKIELAAARFGPISQDAPVGHVTAEARDLFADVGA